MFGAIAGISNVVAELGLTGLDIASTSQQLNSGSIDDMIRYQNNQDVSAADLQRQYMASSSSSGGGVLGILSSSSSVSVSFILLCVFVMVLVL